MEKGTIFKFHNDLDTDQIIASQYLLLPNLEEMKSHAFESLDPDFLHAQWVRLVRKFHLNHSKYQEPVAVNPGIPLPIPSMLAMQKHLPKPLPKAPLVFYISYLVPPVFSY